CVGVGVGKLAEDGGGAIVRASPHGCCACNGQRVFYAFAAHPTFHAWMTGKWDKPALFAAAQLFGWQHFTGRSVSDFRSAFRAAGEVNPGDVAADDAEVRADDRRDHGWPFIECVATVPVGNVLTNS